MRRLPAVGMPGSEMALKELMSRVLGDLLKDGIVTKIADDLYCGGNSPGEILSNWKKVLQALHKCDLCLSAPKTINNSQSTTILGWVWNSGALSASPHRITAHSSELSRCSPTSSQDALHSLQNWTTLSLAVNLRRRLSGQTIPVPHSTRPRQPFPLLTPSRFPSRVISYGS